MRIKYRVAAVMLIGALVSGCTSTPGSQRPQTAPCAEQEPSQGDHPLLQSIRDADSARLEGWLGTGADPRMQLEMHQEGPDSEDNRRILRRAIELAADRLEEERDSPTRAIWLEFLLIADNPSVVEPLLSYRENVSPHIDEPVVLEKVLTYELSEEQVLRAQRVASLSLRQALDALGGILPVNELDVAAAVWLLTKYPYVGNTELLVALVSTAEQSSSAELLRAAGAWLGALGGQTPVLRAMVPWLLRCHQGRVVTPAVMRTSMVGFGPEAHSVLASLRQDPSPVMESVQQCLEAAGVTRLRATDVVSALLLRYEGDIGVGPEAARFLETARRGSVLERFEAAMALARSPLPRDLHARVRSTSQDLYESLVDSDERALEAIGRDGARTTLFRAVRMAEQSDYESIVRSDERSASLRRFALEHIALFVDAEGAAALLGQDGQAPMPPFESEIRRLLRAAESCDRDAGCYVALLRAEPGRSQLLRKLQTMNVALSEEERRELGRFIRLVSNGQARTDAEHFEWLRTIGEFGDQVNSSDFGGVSAPVRCAIEPKEMAVGFQATWDDADLCETFRAVMRLSLRESSTHYSVGLSH